MTALPEGMRKRGNVYWADFGHNGRRIRKSLSRNLKTAKQLLTEMKSRMERGDYGIIDNDCQLGALEKQFLRHCRQTTKPNTVKQYTNCLTNILPAMPQRVRQLSAEAVIAYRDKRLNVDEVKANTINQEVETLGRLIRWGVDQKIIGQNPIAKIKPLPVEDDGSRAWNVTRSRTFWRSVRHIGVTSGMRTWSQAYGTRNWLPSLSMISTGKAER